MKALILAGGKSRRMKTDKLLLMRNSQFLVSPMIEILLEKKFEVFISRSKNQSAFDPLTSSRVILDQHENKGPLGGIYSAMHFAPNDPWLILSCDLYGLKMEVIEELIQKRDPSMDGTFAFNKLRQTIEPLCGIWEPSNFLFIKDSLDLDHCSVFRYLQTRSVKSVSIDSPEALINVNTRQELSQLELLENG